MIAIAIKEREKNIRTSLDVDRGEVSWNNTGNCYGREASVIKRLMWQKELLPLHSNVRPATEEETKL